MSQSPYLNLAIVNPDSTPLVHTVGYVSKVAEVFLSTDKKSRKAKNIIGNPSVAYTADEDCMDSVNKGVQLKGKVKFATDSAVIEKILECIVKKFSKMICLRTMTSYFLGLSPKKLFSRQNWQVRIQEPSVL